MELELEIAIDTMELLRDSNTSVVCSANCTTIGKVCTEKKLELVSSKQRGLMWDSFSMIATVFDFGESTPKCRVHPNLTSYIQTPDINLQQTHTKSGKFSTQLKCFIEVINAKSHV